MIFYLLYRVGEFLATHLPVKKAYTLACAIADIKFYLSGADRNAVIENLRVITNGSVEEKNLGVMAKEVFRNFAKYLADFFRISRMDMEYIERYVEIEGKRYLDEALERGRGVIALTAHIGNWELGGFALSAIGYDTSAVALTHTNNRVNNFFKRKRLSGNMTPIEIGVSLRTCFSVLKKNGILAIVGDRSFSGNGCRIAFFGKDAVIPKGPAFFSYRACASIVPTFMIRKADDTYKLIFEEPILPETSAREDVAIEALTRKYLGIIESYIKRYPTQWYMFREMWNSDEKAVRPDSVI